MITMSKTKSERVSATGNTNGDKLRSMSNELLAAYGLTCPNNFGCYGFCKKYNDCNKCLLDWLNRPADEWDKPHKY